MSALGKLREGCEQARDRGKVPVRAWLGFDGLMDLTTELYSAGVYPQMVECDGRIKIRVLTPHGYVLVDSRPALYEAVIVEARDGEPFIIP